MDAAADAAAGAGAGAAPAGGAAAAAAPGGWSGALHLRPPPVRRTAPPPAPRPRPRPAPPAAAAAQPEQQPEQQLEQQEPPQPGGGLPGFGLEPGDEEYDPARPNDYEAVLAGRARALAAADAALAHLEAERAAAAAAERAELAALEARRRAEEARGAPGALPPPPGPPPGLAPIDAVDAAAAAADAAGLGAGAAADASASPPVKKGMGLAARMMERMGWRRGEGLGREGQGIAAALAVRKTAPRAGVVVPPAARPAPPPARLVLAPENPGTLSRVVLLRNVAGPGGVEAGLDEEVREFLTIIYSCYLLLFIC
jgi:splicing factor 45